MKKHMLLMVSFLILSYFASGCSCAYQKVDVQKIMQHDLVFEGKIIEKEEVSNTAGKNETPSGPLRSMGYFKYTFAVKKLINGDQNQKQIIVYSASTGAACGVNYKLGDEYYLFAYKYQGAFHTGLCSQNVKKDKATKPLKKLMCSYRKSKKLKEWKDIENKLTASGKVVNKKAEGLWVLYHDDKTVKAEGDFVKGKKHGDWKYSYSEVASAKLLGRIDDQQKGKIKNEKNIVYKIEHYDKGEKTGEEYLFKLEN